MIERTGRYDEPPIDPTASPGAGGADGPVSDADILLFFDALLAAVPDPAADAERRQRSLDIIFSTRRT